MTEAGASDQVEAAHRQTRLWLRIAKIFSKQVRDCARVCVCARARARKKIFLEAGAPFCLGACARAAACSRGPPCQMRADNVTVLPISVCMRLRLCLCLCLGGCVDACLPNTVAPSACMRMPRVIASA